MTPRPLIFISAVSRELRSARQLVANTLSFLGYEPVWQEIFGTESGDLRQVLRRQINQCKGVVQLVGRCYGAEPPVVDEQFGRVSYSQYEALYARQRGKKVWYLFIDENFPADPCDAEPKDLHELQAAYRRRLQSDTHVYHPLTTTEGLEASILKLRDDLTRLRRGVKQWAIGVGVLLVISIALGVWTLQHLKTMSRETSETRQSASEIGQDTSDIKQRLDDLMEEVKKVRQVRNKADPETVREDAFVQLAKKDGIDPKVEREKLQQGAAEVIKDKNSAALERAKAYYALGDYLKAEQFALQAADEAQKTTPQDLKKILEALELAGLYAQDAIHYDTAMEHFRAAEKLTDRNLNLDEWVRVQHDIGDLLVADCKYREAEELFCRVTEASERALGPKDPKTTLDSRHKIIYTLTRQTLLEEAETEALDVLRLRQEVLGDDHVDTIVSRYNLADTLIEQGRYPEAEDLCRKIIPLDEKLLGREDPRTIAAQLSLAICLDYQERYPDAQALYREIIRQDEKVFGPDHWRTLNDRCNLASSLHAYGKHTTAEDQFREVIAKNVRPGHYDTLSCRNNFAELLNDEGKYADAETECRQIIPLEEKARGIGPQNRLTLNSRGNLAIALISQGKFDEPEAQYSDLMNVMESVLGLKHPDTYEYASKFATALVRRGRAAEAREFATQLEERARKLLGPDNASTQSFAELRQNLELKK